MTVHFGFEFLHFFIMRSINDKEILNIKQHFWQAVFEDNYTLAKLNFKEIWKLNQFQVFLMSSC